MREGYIFVDDNVYQSFLALSSEEQSRGLMYIKPPTPVMSFIYTTPQINKFWMHNTPAPLDIIFCLGGKVSQVHQGKPFSTAIIGNDEYSDLIIELPQNSAKKCGIRLGSTAGLLIPSWREIMKFTF